MSLNLTNLDNETRRFMGTEFTLDESLGSLYMSPRLNPTGIIEYAGILKESLLYYDDSWLANELLRRGQLNETEQRKKPTGGFSIVKVPYNAHEILAEGEFNRFYIRGLCSRSIAASIPYLVVYRAKQVTNPRSQSEAMIGCHIAPAPLLVDLRTHPGIDTALGLPPGPNSGLSVRLPN